jgi:hypothetical protein
MMADDSTSSSHGGPEVVDSWSARKVQPIVLVYVGLVFAVFIAVAHLNFHSPAAVKALAIAAVGAIIATIPVVLEKTEYRVTPSGLQRRKMNEKKPGQFRDVFQWNELDRVVPLNRGFKYFKKTRSGGLLQRFWQLYLSDTYSGEVHVEKDDLARVLAIVEQRRA